MNTIRITVDNRKNARLLTKMLKSMAFVKKIEDDFPISDNSAQFALLNKLFNAIEPDSMFRDVDNPVEWQKNIRNEWEAR